ncbi:hypothetical protein QAD02_004316 [Eretmocerus hayati]|uniref:Uncharacterized protein n=1 Tax=Eretmocerus hayati TaxID=131215 RepID=A0ACC2NPC9_9HYME|nr:hypothetical protein QAD02_004316 [Eretmocerus hayati]
MMWLWLFIIVFNLSNTCSEPIAETPLGKVFGHYKVSENGRKYAAYEGIPYAKPPMGKLRFEDPVALRNPFRRLSATKKSGVCAQYYDVPPGKDGQPVLNGSLQGTEDCLYLNIYVPELEDPKKLMPVIFFIHGGSFQYASGTAFGDKYLANRDVIFLTINYRLGLLGFLSTEDAVVPGNMGLKDQSLALRWTYDNIKYFRGDAKKIILVGFSAGSSSIQYHYLSPLSHGLFSSSIAMSGTAFNPWAHTGRARQKAKELGALFNCPTSNSRHMINCLKKVPALTLVAATKKFQFWQYNPEAPWAPVVDKYSPRPFISLSPKEILQQGLSYNAPAVYGSVSQEGCDPFAEYAPHDNLLKELNDGWFSIAPYLLEINDTFKRSIHREIASDSRWEYLQDKQINKSTVPQLTEMLTDQRYLIGFETGIRLQAAATKSPVYMYYYSFRGSQSYSDHLSRTHNNYGVCHTDDMNLVVENPDIVPTATKPEWEMSNFLMDMWVSVAYHGVPRVGVGWDPVDAKNQTLKYLHIEAPGKYKMSGSSNFGRKKFWRNFYDIA